MSKNSCRPMRVMKRRRKAAAAYQAAGKRRRTVTTQSIARRRRSQNIRTGGFLGIELKYYDTSRSGVALTNPSDASGAEIDPSTINALNTIAQGDGEQNRDGRNVVMKKISIKGNVTINVQQNVVALDALPVVYLALVQDKQTNGAQLNSEDVFTNPSGATPLAAHPFRNLQYIKRFNVLKTCTLEFENGLYPTYDGTNIEVSGKMMAFEMHKDLNIPVNFTGTTSAIANIADNSLHLIGYCTSTTYAPEVNYNARVRFVG